MEKNSLMEAKKYIQEGRYSAAKKILKKLVKSDKKIKAMLELAKLEWLLGNTLGAKEYLEKILVIEPDNDYALLELGRIAMCDYDFVEARKIYEKILKSSITKKTKEYVILEFGRLEFALGNYDKAMDYYQQLIDSHAFNYECALKEMMSLQIQLKQYSSAYRCFNELVCFSDVLSRDSIQKTQFYLKYHMGMLKDSDIEKNDNYFCQQIFHYNKHKAIHYIREYLVSGMQDISFYSDVSIRKLLRQVEKGIQEQFPVSSNIVDKYRFVCPRSIGSIRGMDTNALEVITIANTKNIINMYPIASSIHFPKIETIGTSLEVEEEKKMVFINANGLSQIDKFYKKYHL